MLAETRRSQLASACRLLEKAADKSPLAVQMVNRLLGVLKRHRVQGIGQEMSDAPRAKSVSSGAGHTATSAASAGVLPSTALPPQQQHHHGQSQQMTMTSQYSYPFGGGQVSTGPVSQEQASWESAMIDSNELAGIWDDLIWMSPADGALDQLFSELDYLSGPF